MYNPLFRRVGFRNLTLLRGKAKYKTDQIVSKSSFGEVSFGDTWYPDPFFCGIKLRHFCGAYNSIIYYTTPCHLLNSLLFCCTIFYFMCEHALLYVLINVLYRRFGECTFNIAQSVFYFCLDYYPLNLAVLRWLAINTPPSIRTSPVRTFQPICSFRSKKPHTMALTGTKYVTEEANSALPRKIM